MSYLIMNRSLFIVVFSFRLFSSGVATANHLPPSNPICILFSNINQLHVLVYAHKAPLWSSSIPPAWLSQAHHPSTNTFTILPLKVSKPPLPPVFSSVSWSLNQTTLMVSPLSCKPFILRDTLLLFTPDTFLHLFQPVRHTLLHLFSTLSVMRNC